MKRYHFGFTLVEVSLFLAITAALFAGVIIGTQNTIWHQRFNDSVENFAEFLRSVYSQVENPQSIGTGQSNTAIYGKLVVFGENKGLSCENEKGKERNVYVYDVVGDIKGTGSGNVKDMLVELNANVIVGLTEDNKAVQLDEDNKDTKLKMVTQAGIVQSYSPKWMATIESTKTENNKLQSYSGSILIVRHPKSGTVNTLVSNTPIQVNETVCNANVTLGTAGGTVDVGVLGGLLKNKIENNSFRTADVDFCVNPNGQDDISIDDNGLKGLPRRDIRIVANARNASGVELINLDTDDNRCKYGN